jgi:hypothetical protein
VAASPCSTAEGIDNQLRQRAAVGGADAVKPGHHWPEEGQIGCTEQAQTPTQTVGNLVDGGGVEIALFDADHVGDLCQLFQQRRERVMPMPGALYTRMPVLDKGAISLK